MIELAQIVVFYSAEECIAALLETEGTIEVKHSFHAGQAIIVSAEDAMLLRLSYGDKIKIVMPVGEFLKDLSG